MFISCSSSNKEEPVPVNPGGRLLSRSYEADNTTDYYIYENERVVRVERKNNKTGDLQSTSVLTYSPSGNVIAVHRNTSAKSLLVYLAEYDGQDRLSKVTFDPNPESVAQVYSYTYDSAGLATQYKYHIENPASPRPGAPTYYQVTYNPDNSIRTISRQDNGSSSFSLWMTFFYEDSYNAYYRLALPAYFSYANTFVLFSPIRNIAKFTHPYSVNGKTVESTGAFKYEYDAKGKVISSQIALYADGETPRFGDKSVYTYQD